MDNKNSKIATEAEPAVKREKQKKCKKNILCKRKIVRLQGSDDRKWR